MKYPKEIQKKYNSLIRWNRAYLVGAGLSLVATFISPLTSLFPSGEEYTKISQEYFNSNQAQESYTRTLECPYLTENTRSNIEEILKKEIIKLDSLKEEKEKTKNPLWPSLIVMLSCIGSLWGCMEGTIKKRDEWYKLKKEYDKNNYKS